MAINNFETMPFGTTLIPNYTRNTTYYRGWAVPGCGAAIDGVRSVGMVQVPGLVLADDVSNVIVATFSTTAGGGPTEYCVGYDFWTPNYPDEVTLGSIGAPIKGALLWQIIDDRNNASEGVPMCSFFLNPDGTVSIRTYPTGQTDNFGVVVGTTTEPLPLYSWHRLRMYWSATTASMKLDGITVLSVDDDFRGSATNPLGTMGKYRLAAPSTYRADFFTNAGGNPNLENWLTCAYFDNLYADSNYDTDPAPDFSTPEPAEHFDDWNTTPATGVKYLESFAYNADVYYKGYYVVGDDGERGFTTDQEWAEHYAYATFSAVDHQDHYLMATRIKLGTENMESDIFTFTSSDYAGAVINVRLDSEGRPSIYWSDTNTVIATATDAIPRFEYHILQATFDISAPTVSVNVYIDQTLCVSGDINATGDPILDAGDTVFVSWMTPMHAVEVAENLPHYMHSLVLTSGAESMSPLPLYSVKTLRPLEDGRVTSFAPVSGTNIDVMRQALPLPQYSVPASSFVSINGAQGPAAVDLYTVEPAPDLQTVHGVIVTIYAKAASRVMNAITPAYYNGTTDVHYEWPKEVGYGYNATYSAVPQRFRFPMGLNPITESAWTETDITDGQWGYRLNVAQGKTTTEPFTNVTTMVQGLFVDVLYTPPPPFTPITSVDPSTDKEIILGYDPQKHRIGLAVSYAVDEVVKHDLYAFDNENGGWGRLQPTTDSYDFDTVTCRATAERDADAHLLFGNAQGQSLRVFDPDNAPVEWEWRSKEVTGADFGGFAKTFQFTGLRVDWHKADPTLAGSVTATVFVDGKPMPALTIAESTSRTYVLGPRATGHRASVCLEGVNAEVTALRYSLAEARN